MNSDPAAYRTAPAQHFLGNAVFARAFEPLREALDEQQRALGDLPSPWLTRFGKGGPNYPDYRAVCLAQHCLDVGFLAALMLILRWCRGDLDEHGILQTDEAAMELLLKRLLALAMAHDADKYVGARSRSPAADDVARVHRDLNIAAWTELTVDQLGTLVNRVEQRGMAASFLAGALPATDSLIADVVHLADNVLSKAARAESTGIDDPDQTLLDALQAGLKKNLGIDIGRWEMRRFRHNPAVLARLRRALLNAIPTKSGCPPWILTLTGDELSVSMPADLDMQTLGRRLQEQFDQAHPKVEIIPNDGKTILRDVADADDLLEALKNGRRHGLLLRVADGDVETMLPWLRDWIAYHGVLALNVDPVGEHLIQLLSFADFGVDDWSCPVTRALGLAVVLKAGVSSPAKELPARFERLANLLETPGSDSLDTLGPEWTTLDPHARVTQAALQIAADQDDAEAFEQLLNELIKTIFGDRFAHRPDPGSESIVVGLLRQVGIAAAETPTRFPYQAHPAGGTCLTCGTATDQVYKKDSPVPDIKVSAFSNRIGHQKDLFSEKAGTTFMCPACVKSLGLLGNLMQEVGRPLSLKDENLVNVAVPIQSRLLPTALPRGKALSLLDSRLAVGKERTQRRLQLTPWHVNFSGTPVLCVERVKDGLEAAIDLHLRTAQTALWSGCPVQLFRGRQHSARGAFYSELMPPQVAALLQDLQLRGQPACTIAPDRLHALYRRLRLLNDLIRRKDGKGRTVINDLGWAGWWALAWLHRLNPDDKSLTEARLSETREEFPMPVDTLLSQLGSRGAEIQKKPDKGMRDTGNVLSISFDTALETYTQSLAEKRDAADGIAAIQRKLYETLFRRKALEYHLRADELDAHCRAFAECAWEIFHQNTRHDDLSGNTRRYLRAAYITYFLAAAEARRTAPDSEQTPEQTIED